MRGGEGEEVRGGSEDCVGIVREGEGRAIGRNGYSTVRMKGCELGVTVLAGEWVYRPGHNWSRSALKTRFQSCLHNYMGACCPPESVILFTKKQVPHKLIRRDRLAR